MKKTLTLLLLIPCFCWGQKKDTAYYINGDILNTQSGVATMIGGFGSESYPKQDTVKLLMLVCDTAKVPHGSMLYIRKQDQLFNDGKMVWWQFGYAIFPVVQTNNMLPPYFDQVPDAVYLDEKKKPLQKSIIVWMTKEIK